MVLMLKKTRGRRGLRNTESEDEDGEELTPAVDAAILRTLVGIKTNDPSIYGQEKGIYDKELKTCELKLSSRTRKDKFLKETSLHSTTCPPNLLLVHPRPSHSPMSKSKNLYEVKVQRPSHAAIEANNGIYARRRNMSSRGKKNSAVHEILRREVGEHR
ncbi:hypothetical protein BDY19DRAFT_721720 [Irpex rosettiformis]|uniref:Uncharacterized protein n=1 Tax=Irpex rosettiformis TaxID=378272 RepID=A0ACB8U909_9APHY|nr:hypothetical protein BDY19DRAFT_721720 [Irpex rosettiformis]